MTAAAEQFPNVSSKQKRLVETYGALLTNTGGNDPLDLLEDLQRPDSRIASTNIVRFTLAAGINSQLQLLAAMERAGIIVQAGEGS